MSMDLAEASTPFTRSAEAADSIRNRLPPRLVKPQIAIICGSGLGDLQHSLLPPPSPCIEIPYADIPHFPLPTGE